MSIKEKKDVNLLNDLNQNINNKISNPYLKILKEKDDEIIKIKYKLKVIEEKLKSQDKIKMDDFINEEDCFKLEYLDDKWYCLNNIPKGPQRPLSDNLETARKVCKTCEYNMSLKEIKKLIEEGPTFYYPFCFHPNKLSRGGMPTSDLKNMYCPELRGNISIEKCEQCKYFKWIEIEQKKRKKKKITNKIKS